MNQRIRLTILTGILPCILLTILRFALGLENVQAQVNTFVVTSSADSGPGTLREALLNANIGDTITFEPTNFPPTTPTTISLTDALPTIVTDSLTIDASGAGVILHSAWQTNSFPCFNTPLPIPDNNTAGVELHRKILDLS